MAFTDDKFNPPSKSNKNFVFDFELVKEAEKDLNLRIEAAEEAINKITDICTIKTEASPTPWPIIKSILQFSTDEEELIQLGKGLIKVAPIIKELEDLRKKNNFVKLASDQQSWIMSHFGDFTNDFNGFENIDQVLKSLGDNI